MLVVTHEMGLVEQFPNRLIVINEGLIVSDKMNG
jgi:ABC-type polar amino acid transport system ATPase subunit